MISLALLANLLEFFCKPSSKLKIIVLPASINLGAFPAIATAPSAIISPRTLGSCPISLVTTSLSLSTCLVTDCTTSLKGLSTCSKSAIPKPSSADFNIVKSPLRLSFMVLAIFSAAPVELLIEFVSLLKSSSLASKIASIPAIDSLPKRVVAA